MNIQSIICIYLILGMVISYFLTNSEISKEGVKEAIEKECVYKLIGEHLLETIVYIVYAVAWLPMLLYFVKEFAVMCYDEKVLSKEEYSLKYEDED